MKKSFFASFFAPKKVRKKAPSLERERGLGLRLKIPIFRHGIKARTLLARIQVVMTDDQRLRKGLMQLLHQLPQRAKGERSTVEVHAVFQPRTSKLTVYKTQPPDLRPKYSERI